MATLVDDRMIDQTILPAVQPLVDPKIVPPSRLPRENPLVPGSPDELHATARQVGYEGGLGSGIQREE